MKTRCVLIVASAVLMGACAKFKSNDLRSGNGIRIFPKAQAVNVLTRAARWCYEDVDGDRVFGTHVFNKDASGEFAIFDAKKNSFITREHMVWDINGDVITMTLDSKKVLAQPLRFSGKIGSEKMVLLASGKNVQATLTVCDP